jgi:hypothetical protein
MSSSKQYRILYSVQGLEYCFIRLFLYCNMSIVGPMHFLFTVCENYAKLLSNNNWRELSTPCSVVYLPDVTLNPNAAVVIRKTITYYAVHRNSLFYYVEIFNYLAI